jgi:hypothetical protein
LHRPRKHDESHGDRGGFNAQPHTDAWNPDADRYCRPNLDALANSDAVNPNSDANCFAGHADAYSNLNCHAGHADSHSNINCHADIADSHTNINCHADLADSYSNINRHRGPDFNPNESDTDSSAHPNTNAECNPHRDAGLQYSGKHLNPFARGDR